MTETNFVRKITIYMCEDLEADRKRLSEVLTSLEAEFHTEAVYFESAEALLEELQGLQETKKPFPDLVILDIELPGMDGITLGRTIREMNADVILAFATAHPEYAAKGYGMNAFCFLVKPLSAIMIRELLMDIKAEEGKKKKISVKTGEGKILIPLRDLVYISAEDKYTILYTAEKHYVSDCSLNKYEEQLQDFGFYRIHRKYLVNFYHHKGIKAGKILLSGGQELICSRKRMADYQAGLLRFLRGDLV